MNKLIFALILIPLPACMLAEGDIDALDVASTAQALQTCTASCDLPAWNGVPVSCSSSIYCVAYTNGVYCDTGGTPIIMTCSACGNGSCNAGETAASCAMDCGCGNGSCGLDESPCGCAWDCSVCGDNVCDELEMGGSCPGDCEPFDPWCF